jgi:hypothetical protein
MFQLRQGVSTPTRPGSGKRQSVRLPEVIAVFESGAWVRQCPKQIKLFLDCDKNRDKGKVRHMS